MRLIQLACLDSLGLYWLDLDDVDDEEDPDKAAVIQEYDEVWSTESERDSERDDDPVDPNLSQIHTFPQDQARILPEFFVLYARYGEFQIDQPLQVACPLCQIAYHDDTEVGATNCAHFFCERCLRLWCEVEQQVVCPVCRTRIRGNDVE